jgi:hypothetical protein
MPVLLLVISARGSGHLVDEEDYATRSRVG